MARAISGPPAPNLKLDADENIITTAIIFVIIDMELVRSSHVNNYIGHAGTSIRFSISGHCNSIGNLPEIN